MTKQEILDTIDREFKGKATTNSLDCEYLTPDGKKCAIGVFLPDGHDAQKKECGVRILLGVYPELWEYMPSANLDILIDFQIVHDRLDWRLPLEKQKQILIDFVEQHF